MRPLLLALLLVLATPALAPLAVGDHGPDVPPLAYRLRVETPVWVVLDVENLGYAMLSIELGPSVGARMGQLALTHATGVYTSSIWASDASSWLHAETAGEEVDFRVLPAAWGGGRSGGVGDASAFSRITAWAAGAEWVEVTIYTSEPGFSAVEVARGTRAWVSDGSDWQMERTSLLASAEGSHVSFVENAMLPVEVRGRFTGFVGLPPSRATNWQEEVTITGPDGMAQTCPCTYRLGDDPRYVLGPGEYTLRRTAIGVAGGPPIPFAGADIEV